MPYDCVRCSPPRAGYRSRQYAPQIERTVAINGCRRSPEWQIGLAAAAKRSYLPKWQQFIDRRKELDSQLPAQLLPPIFLA